MLAPAAAAGHQVKRFMLPATGSVVMHFVNAFESEDGRWAGQGRRAGALLALNGVLSLVWAGPAGQGG